MLQEDFRLLHVVTVLSKAINRPGKYRDLVCVNDPERRVEFRSIERRWKVSHIGVWREQQTKGCGLPIGVKCFCSFVLARY